MGCVADSKKSKTFLSKMDLTLNVPRTVYIKHSYNKKYTRN